MSKQASEELLRALAEGISEVLPKIYKKEMGFMLVVSPFGEDSPIADYIGNCKREDGIEWLRETADRLEQGQDIPTTKGNA